MLPLILYSIPILFVLSWMCTGIVRRFALSEKILDIPNERSSHNRPVPRGGGLAFVILFLIFMPVLIYLDYISLHQGAALEFSTLLVAIIGFMDDYHSLSARTRLTFHVLAASISLFFLGFTDNVVIFFIGMGYLVWMLNLYNFMDGIDGIATLEAIFISVAGSIAAFIDGNNALLALSLLLLPLTSGFLLWNFPRAQIFMGDVGSGFLGLLFGLFSLIALQYSFALFIALLILLGVFITDATVTLITRAVTSQHVLQAHCNHGYQKLIGQGFKHSTVSLAALAINSIWLLPLSILVTLQLIHPMIGLILAYIPLVFIAIYLRAGIAINYE